MNTSMNPIRMALIAAIFSLVAIALLSAAAVANADMVPGEGEAPTALMPAPVIPTMPQIGKNREDTLRVFCWTTTLDDNQIALAADADAADQISFTFHGRSQSALMTRNVFAVGYELSPEAYAAAQTTGRLGPAVVKVKADGRQFQYRGNPLPCNFS